MSDGLLQHIPNLRRVSDTEYKGPCPLCNEGRDRFCLWTGGGIENTGRYYCRRCEKSGNAVKLLRELGMNEAAARVVLRLDSLEDWKKRPWALGTETGRWTYCDESGKPLYDIVRYEPPTDHPLAGKDKTFLPYKFGVGRAGLGDVRRVPYLLPELLEGATKGSSVIHVEGERHAEKLSSIGFVTSTTVSGSSGWRDEYADYYIGASLVAVLADCDEPGRRYARDVAKSMQRRKIPVKLVELPGLSKGGDVLDWLAAGGTANGLRAIIQDTPHAEPISDEPASARVSHRPTQNEESKLTAWLAGDAVLSNDEVIQALRDLSPLEYDMVRKEAAEKLGCRVSTLDDEQKRKRGNEEPASTLFEEVEPWPEPVDGASLLSEIRYVLHTYLAFSEEDATTIALWIMHTHAKDVAEASPILSFTSPEKRCGKTTALSLLSALVHRPAGGSSFTRASVYRVVEKYSPTLLIDEADSTVFKQGSDSELRGIINSGHTRRMAYVWVCVGDDHEPTQFSTFTPKSIACIGSLPDTIADRSIEIRMRRKTPLDNVKRFRERVVSELKDIRCQCRRWTDDNLNVLRLSDPNIPDSLSDRAADSWAPLLAIANAAGGDWPESARRAAVKLSGTGTSDNATIRTELLRDLYSIFREAGNPDALPTAELLDALNKIDERPWPTYHRGKELSARGLGALLKPFEIHSDTIRFGAITAKGYYRNGLTDAFSRYLPETAVTTVTNENNDHSALETLFPANRASVTTENPVTDKNDRNQPAWAGNGNVTHVSNKRGDSQGEEINADPF